MFLALCFCPLVSSADEPAGVRHVLIICGHPGDDEHHKLFSETVDRLQRGLIANLHVAANQIHVQFGAEPAPEDPEVVTSARGRSSREEIAANVRELQQQLQPEDALWVIVLGHAHFDGRQVHLNLPGPDLRTDEFAKLFEEINCREQVFFMTCPLSGYFIKPLTAPFRVIISATEADLEFNETLFPLALADVLLSPPHRDEFDVDRDGEISLFDLYITVVRRAIERYQIEMSFITEHALLEDNGDGRGGEVQVDYLTAEQGGRWNPGTTPQPPKKDGIFSSRLSLAIVLPPRPPDVPADALTPENSSVDDSQ